MAERLREVAKELPADWIDLLGQQADLIDEGGGTLENGPGRTGWPAWARAWASQKVHKRKVPSSPSRPFAGPIAIDQSPLVGEPLLCRGDRGQHPRIVCRKKSHQGHHQVGSVDFIRSEGLGERLGPVAPALGHDRLTDLVPRLRP